MRTLVLLCCAIFTLCSCVKSNEGKAKELIKAHLKNTMKDWSSYEEVQFGKLDSTFIDYGMTEEAKALQLEISQLQDKADSIKAISELNGNNSTKERLALIQSAIKLDSIYNNHKETYKGSFSGWSMLHKYRGNNSYGSKEIATSVFYFDTNLIKVIEQLPLD